ncbi:carboxylesterase family protein [Kocuria nitroreducens]|uniref:carboxylesterase family protein n=1 Tax=Kocuria nitroreducens TaxID=3058914 RepID=UPI0036DECDBE
MTMTIATHRARTTLAALSLIGVLTVTGCSPQTTDTSAAAAASTATATANSGTSDSATSSAQESADLETLVAEVTEKFDQATYTDSGTGRSLPYNIYLPEDYDASTSYPLVLYIADSSLVGQDVTAPLSEYGALIWASDSEQAKQESIVIVPEYPEVIIDDHGSYTTTDYVEMTARLVADVGENYSVDTDRVYGTGQSMGCMTVMYLAAQHPELFAAELLVSGQWDAGDLANLTGEKFLYFAAAGDENASGGQTDVQGLLDEAGVGYGTTTLDATAPAGDQEAAITELVADGNTANFATFTTGSVLEAAGSDASSGMGGSSEHMASFQPAYEIAAARDWLLAQSAG